LQAFFTEKYLQEHPEDQDKIELLKQLIALQVSYWERLGSTMCECWWFLQRHCSEEIMQIYTRRTIWMCVQGYFFFYYYFEESVVF